MTKQTEIKGNAVTEREAELWDAIYVAAYRDAVARGLGFRAARRPARMNANAEITRLRLHRDTVIESVLHAKAITADMAEAHDAPSPHGPRFNEMNGGRRIEAARDRILAATTTEATAAAIADYLATVTTIRDHAYRLASGERF